MNFPALKNIGCPQCNGLGYLLDLQNSNTKRTTIDLCQCAQSQCQCENTPPYYYVETANGPNQLIPCPILPLHRKIEHIQRYYAQSELPYKFRFKFYNSHFATHHINQHKEFIKQINTLLPPIWEGEEANLSRGLFFTGQAGSGKTHLAAIVINELILRHALRAIFLKTTRLLDRLRATYSQNSRTYGQGEALEQLYSSVPAIVLDDFGAQQETDWAAETLYDMIDQRYEKGLFTVITSNKNLNDLASAAEGRIASRFKEMTHTIEFPAIDYRDLLAANLS